MPDTRTLPISAEQREFTVKAGGQEVSRSHHLLSVSVTLAANRIGWARLAYQDGAASGGDFALSDTDLFKPGQTVEILAGGRRDRLSLFKGVVVRHSLRLRDTSAPQLVVDCRHAAMKLTVATKSASYFDHKDSEIIAALLSDAGISAEVESTSVTHRQLVQFQCSDWDFLLARAAANGKLVWPDGERLIVKSPAIAATAGVTLRFGATLLELDAEIDARQQYSGVRGISWDAAQQALAESSAAAPAFSGPGNLAPDDLSAVAGAGDLELRHSTLQPNEAQAWADAAFSRARLDKVSGRAKCTGIAAIKPGDTVALAGVGARFNGNVFVSGVRHESDLVQGWKTHLQFGGVAEAACQPAASPAGSLLARVAGLQIGVVESLEDPDGEHRVRVRLPLLGADSEGIWARVASLDAGNERGFFFRPEIGDEVVLGFLDEDPRHAVLLGMLHSSAKPAPLPAQDDNNEKLYKSRAGMRLYFDDDKKVMRLDTPAGNSLTLSEDDKSIVLADQHGNTLKMDADGIALASMKALKLKAATEIAIESGTALSAKGGTELKLEGGTQAELSSSAVTSVKGSMVQIN
ncbi:MAG: type VI secretion system tip protein VgrG [Gallionella sp.]|nr:type VI secretion system tip protein VgrG [Gallionella sp.]MDD4946098.1 type VI secretion system tip protein VgrG [Gallionella sp.]